VSSKIEAINGERMKFSKENITLFDQYLANELEAQDRTSFESRLEEDAIFKGEFEAYKEFEASIRSVETVEIYDRVQSWDQQTLNSVAKIRKIKFWMTVAASAAVVFIVMSVFLKGSSNTELVDEYFEPYGNISTVRGKKETIDQGLSFYDREKYQQALTQFKQYPQDTLAIFYSGESYLALKEYKKAIERFDKIIDFNINLSEVARFHKGISLIGLGKRGEAKKVLSEIPGKSSYHDQIEALLEHL